MKINIGDNTVWTDENISLGGNYVEETNGQTDKLTSQKLYAIDLSMRGHKNLPNSHSTARFLLSFILDQDFMNKPRSLPFVHG